MTKLGAIAFKNQQNHRYDFSIYPMDAEFKPGHGGVYIITCRHDDQDAHHHGHKIIHIGQTADMAVALCDHPDLPDFEEAGANCCCVHATQDEAARKRIVAELTERYLNKS